MSFSIDHLILIHPILPSHNGPIFSMKERIIFEKGSEACSLESKIDVGQGINVGP